MPPQLLDDDTAIVEHAKACGAIPRRVMQAGDRHEGAPVRAPAMIHSVAARLAPTTPAAASYTPRNAGVSPPSSIADAGLGALAHELHVLGRMEQLQLERRWPRAARAA